jgi:sensor histidine kinase YesM
VADWVIAEFGHLTAADLELESTLVYTDREAHRSEEEVSIAELARRVRDVKPHFTNEQVVRHAESLRSKGLLKATRKQ